MRVAQGRHCPAYGEVYLLLFTDQSLLLREWSRFICIASRAYQIDIVFDIAIQVMLGGYRIQHLSH